MSSRNRPINMVSNFSYMEHEFLLMETVMFFFVFGIYILKKKKLNFFFKCVEKTLMRKPDWLVSTFLRHFIFDGAVLLIIKLKFFSGNTDFLKKIIHIDYLIQKKEKKCQKNFIWSNITDNWASGSSVQTFHNLNCLGMELLNWPLTQD